MDREKMLDVTLQQIEKQFGKGAVMKLGEHPMGAGITVDPHRIAGARHRARRRRHPTRSDHRGLRPRGLGQDHGLPAHHRGGAGQGRHRGVHRRRARARSHLRPRARRQHRRAAGLASRTPASRRSRSPTCSCGRRALDIVVDRLGGRARSSGRDRGRDGRHARRPAGAPDVPGHAEAGGDPVAVRHDRRSSSTSSGRRSASCSAHPRPPREAAR